MAGGRTGAPSNSHNWLAPSRSEHFRVILKLNTDYHKDNSARRTPMPPDQPEQIPTNKAEQDEEPDGTDQSEEEEKVGRRRPIKLPFGLPESPYDTIKKILRAMGKLGGAGTPLTLQQVQAAAGLTTRTVSGNNKFLFSTGLITRSGNNFYLTERGAQLALALDYDDAEDASRAWRAVVAENEFFRKVLAALDIQGGMKEDEFAARIAKTAQAPNEPSFLTGARAIVDILLETGLVAEDGDSGKLSVTADYRNLSFTSTGLTPKEEPGITSPHPEPAGSGRPSGPQIVLNVNVSIDAQTTPDNVAAIASRIKELRDQLR